MKFIKHLKVINVKKLFYYLRNIDSKRDIVTIYGLDADLIMLSLLHCKYTRNIFVFREAPSFNTVISGQYKPNDILFLDINILSNSIFSEMGNYDEIDKDVRVYDYIFMCFLLGNDFLPHFPALNIRTNGIQILSDTYYQVIGKYKNRSLVINNDIQWHFFNLFLKELAKNEHKFIINEYKIRSKWDQRKWPIKTSLDKNNFLLNIPVIYRTDEKYICPDEYGWEHRYYKRLFHTPTDDIEILNKQINIICKNYFEGIQWVLKYYTSDCENWTWKYNYSYPPLLSDLKNFNFIQPNKTPQEIYLEKKIFTPLQQLMYVLPKNQRSLLIDNIKCDDTNKEDIKYMWGFCRYFWESHPQINDDNPICT
jgi:5'-3' exonuclease